VVNIRGRRAWHELSPSQRWWITLLGAVQAGLLAAALRDVVHRPAAELTAPKPVWVAACFVNFVGPLAYFVFGRHRGSGRERRRCARER
jgi:drug/metabolite transporter (DMT)-like permease